MGQAKKFFSKTLKTAIQSTYNQQFSYDFIIFEPFQSKVRNPLQVDIRKLLKITPSTLAKQDTPTRQAVPQLSFGYALQTQLTFDTVIS